LINQVQTVRLQQNNKQSNPAVFNRSDYIEVKKQWQQEKRRVSN